MKKNKFFTLLFSLLPGAGQMYQGRIKRGVSLMVAFFGLIAISSFLYIEPLLILLPVVWFYSFFDCINRWNMTVVELDAIEDKFMLDSKFMDNDTLKKYFKNKNGLMGGIVLFIGLLLLYNTVIRELLWKLERFIPGIRQIASKLPAIVIAIILILVGIMLINGKKSNVEGDTYDK